MSNFLEKLGSEDWLLADGATGTNLFDMGLKSGDAPELWNITYPDRISNLYRDAVDAGSDIFLTNSFGANALRLKLHNLGTKAFELSKISAELTISLQLSKSQVGFQKLLSKPQPFIKKR